MPSRELTLLAFFGVCWLLALGMVASGFPLAGSLPLNLYGLYSIAAAGGWLAGNLHVTRRAGLAAAERRLLLLVYLVGPMGLLYLLHTLGPRALRLSVPLAPLWAFGVFLILFLVPVSFRR